MLLLLIANLIILPVAISFFDDGTINNFNLHVHFFSHNFLSKDLSMSRIIFNIISDTIFLCDIVLNFRTGKILKYGCYKL